MDTEPGGFRQTSPEPRSDIRAEDGYDFVVPHATARDVTPPQMRGGAQRRDTLRHAFESSFSGAAPRERRRPSVSSDAEWETRLQWLAEPYTDEHGHPTDADRPWGPADIFL